MGFNGKLLARATPAAVPAQRIKPKVRVHGPSNPVIWADQDLHYVLNLQTSAEMPDGVALCPLMHEIPLKHWGGNHPLRHVTCKRCPGSLVYNEMTWSATAILCRENESSVKAAIITLPSAADSYGRLCATCGLSHRASSPGFDGQCQCGMLPSSLDVYFHLGRPNSFRRDPDQAGQSLRLKHVQAHAQQYPNQRPGAPAQRPREEPPSYNTSQLQQEGPGPSGHVRNHR